jgi:pimeloyl-ACP methyl ester carboxylesterase
MTKRATQRIRYLRTEDGVQLAWAEAGTGPVLIKAANWMTHLEYEWESPVWRHWIRFFTDHFRYVRHDERECGMTDWNVGDLSLERWVKDLEAVVAAADPREPFALLGISQGAATCVGYAVRHPERVSQLVLYGGYARGPFRRGDPDRERMYQAMIDLVRLGWGKDNPAFRQVFTSRFIPGGTDEQIGWFNDLCLKTTSPEIAARLLESRATIDVVALLEGWSGRQRWCCTRGTTTLSRFQRGTFLPPGSQVLSSSSLTRRTTSSLRTNRPGNAFAMRCWTSWDSRARLAARTPRSPRSPRASDRCWR